MENSSLLDSKPITCCQVCGAKPLQSLIFLGYVPLLNDMPNLTQGLDAEMRFPVELLRCPDCSLVQIGYAIDPHILFPEDYLYLSGTTKALRDNFTDLVREVSELFPSFAKGLAVDIGANDGSLLLAFQKAGYRTLGVEPTKALEKAQHQGIPMVKNYFSQETAQKIRSSEGAAKIVTATNVFAHVLKIHEFVDAIVDIMAPDGLFISESHYVLDLIKTLQYDAVYHDHLKYYSVGSLSLLLEPHGLEIIRITRIPTHGGSIRVYAARKGVYPLHASVADHLAEEEALGLKSGQIFNSFRSQVIASKLSLLALIQGIKASGKKIYGVGAPSRATTLTNYVGLDDGLIDMVVEVSNSNKINKFMPGTRIPVLEEERLFNDQPEYALLYSWHIADELAKNLRKKGYKGDFIIPLPTPRIIR